MEEVIEVLARGLVEFPDEVRIVEADQRGNTYYVTVAVAPSDVGKVIGRQGRIANAIRAVAATVAARDGLRAVVDFTS
jgi:predicted RNA-binding protein YlqC (UPF0109 family)